MAGRSSTKWRLSFCFDKILKEYYDATINYREDFNGFLKNLEIIKKDDGAQFNTNHTGQSLIIRREVIENDYLK